MDAIYALYDELGSWVKVARKLEISPSYLSDITGNRRDISDKLAKRLGCRRRPKYVKVEDFSNGR